MNVSITIPDDVALTLQDHWQDLPRRALETLVADGYREGLLTSAQIRDILTLETRLDVDAFLKKAGVHRNYTQEDLEQDFELARRLSEA